MGERCTIGTAREDATVMYLHWNSTPEEVTALTDYCAIQKYRSPDRDPMYGMARMCQVACNTWGNHAHDDYENGLSVGISPFWKCDQDYGHYVLDGWFIARREEGTYTYSDVDIENLDEGRVWEYVTYINAHQPDHVRLDDSELRQRFLTRFSERTAYRRDAKQTEDRTQTSYTEKE